MVFIQQGGRNRHEHICESLELFADRVMPGFKENEDERQKQKMEELAPYLEKAMERKKFMKPLADDEIPEIVALGRQIAEGTVDDDSEVARRWRERMQNRAEIQRS